MLVATMALGGDPISMNLLDKLPTSNNDTRRHQVFRETLHRQFHTLAVRTAQLAQRGMCGIISNDASLLQNHFGADFP